MGRNDLLKQKREYEEALKKAMQNYKDPASIKYDLHNEKNVKIGYVEYFPKNDSVEISGPSGAMMLEGDALKSLKDVIDKLLDD